MATLISVLTSFRRESPASFVLADGARYLPDGTVQRCGPAWPVSITELRRSFDVETVEVDWPGPRSRVHIFTHSQQEMEERTSTFGKQRYQEVQKRLDFLQHGQTIVEVTADIADPRMRIAVREALLFVYALSLGTSLCIMEILTQQQADELRAYLSERLVYTLTNAPPLFLPDQVQKDRDSM